jgi:hypothetical protein
VLSKATTILAALFMVTCLALSLLRPKSSSVLDKAGAATAPAAAPSAPASLPATSVPAASVPPASVPAAAPAPAATPSAQ